MTAGKVGEVSTLVDDGRAGPVGGQSSAEPVIVEVDPSHYDFQEVVARGGVGVVIKARDRRLLRPVAVKQILRGSGTMQARFEREAWLTARLQHPGIVPIYEAGRWPNGESFYAMRLVEGRPLSEVIAGCATLDERLALLPKVVAVAEAVAYAHTQRVMHRDLKPQNVMIGAFGDVVVIDWGLAKELDRSAAVAASDGDGGADPGSSMETIAGAVVGTPSYMPPEQARGQPVDERADVYALGALLYHVLTGAPPFTGASNAQVLEQVLSADPTPVEVRQPGVPRDLGAVVGKAMAPDPQTRYATAGELCEELQRFVTGQLVRAHQYPRAVLVRRALRRHPLMTAIGVFALVLALLGSLAVRRIIVAREAAESRGRELLLGQARALLQTDPTASVALLKRYPDGARDIEAVRAIALDAESRGVSRRALSLHAGDVRDVAFSPDGAELASAGSDGALILWDVTTGTARRLHASHSAVTNVRFDPRGRHLAAAVGGVGGMYLWDRRARTMRQLPLESSVFAIDFSPDGRLLAGGEVGGTIYVWNVADGKRRDLTGHTGWIVSVEFSPDGERLLSTSEDGTARLWNLASGAARTLPLGAHGWGGAFSRDGRRAAVGCEDGSVHVFSVADEATPPAVHRQDGAGVDYVAFAPDGARLAWAGMGGDVHVLDLRSGAASSLRGHEDDVVGLGFLPDGTLMSASSDGTMRRWDLASGTASVLRGHSDHIRAMAISARGDRVASAGDDRGVRLWELRPAPRTHAVGASKEGDVRSSPDNDFVYFQRDTGEVGVLGLRDGALRVIRPERRFARFAGHPAGQRIAYRDLKRRISIIELGSAVVERSLPADAEGVGIAMEFSPDGTSLAFPGWEGIHLVDVASQKRRELRYPSGSIRARNLKIGRIQFSRDGRRLLAVAGTTEIAEIAIWDVATGRATSIAPPAPRAAGAVFASPDLTAVAAGAAGGLWLLEAGRGGWRRLMSTPREIVPIAFSGDGGLLAAADDHGRLRLWRVGDGALVHELAGHQGPVRTLAFDRDGRRLVSAGADGAARIWDVHTGQQLRAIRAHGGRDVVWAGFRGDDIATAGRDGTVRVWPASRRPPGPVRGLLDALTAVGSDR